MPFRDVVGHRRLVGLLTRSVARGTLPPSLIFAGPDGVGKRLVATAMAQAFNCLAPLASAGDGPAVDACGLCAACSRIARGIHPDVLTVEPGDTGTIKIDQVRDVIDRAAYRPFEGRRRVVIIDDADALVAQAQNALLKTLEEPPPSSMFVLVTARPDTLLETVRSRCPRLRFRPLSAHDIAAVLVARGRAAAEARTVAAMASGSLRAALELDAEEARAVRDIAERVLVRAAASADPRRRLEATKDLLARTGGTAAADREQVAACLRSMSTLLRDAALMSVRPDPGALANADAEPAVERLARTYGGDRGMRAFQAVDQALLAIQRNAGVKVVADWVVMQL